MNEEQFNADLRKFLKRFGVTAQREIERAVERAIESGKLVGNETLKVRATLDVDGISLDVVIDEEIRLA